MSKYFRRRNECSTDPRIQALMAVVDLLVERGVIDQTWEIDPQADGDTAFTCLFKDGHCHGRLMVQDEGWAAIYEASGQIVVDLKEAQFPLTGPVGGSVLFRL